MEENRLSTEEAERLILAIAQDERDVMKSYNQFKAEYSQVFSNAKKYERALEEIQERKKALKRELTEARDFDLHKLSDGKLKVAVTNISRIEVVDPEKVPDEYKSYGVVIDEKAAKESFVLTGELPAGFRDKSYPKLTWKDEVLKEIEDGEN